MQYAKSGNASLPMMRMTWYFGKNILPVWSISMDSIATSFIRLVSLMSATSFGAKGQERDFDLLVATGNNASDN